MQTPFSPIPGSGLPARGFFVDHWGTLLRPGPDDTPFRPELLVDGATEALFRAGQNGWRLYLVGNEASVPYGRRSIESWRTFEAEMLEHLRGRGVPIRRSYICPDDPSGRKPHDKDSVYFMPNTGALYHAAQNDRIRLEHSWVIGDSTLELVAGWRAGCHTAGVRTGLGLGDRTLHIEPDLIAMDLAEALLEVLAGSFSPRP